MHVRVHDTVQVLRGDQAGTRAKVLSVDHESGKVVVEGVNRVWKHVRRSQRNPQGGRLNKEMPVQASNVLLVCTACGRATRVGKRFASDGAKERFCRKCGAAQGTIAPAPDRKAKAK